MNQFLTLDRNEFVRLHGAHRLRVTRGTLWLTIDRDPDDHLLTPGLSLELPPGADALVQALEAPARACIERPDPWWRRLAQALRQASVREVRA